MEFQEVKTSVDAMHSPWAGYEGQSLGRVIHYIYYYLGYNIAEDMRCGNNKVSYRCLDNKVANRK